MPSKGNANNLSNASGLSATERFQALQVLRTAREELLKSADALNDALAQAKAETAKGSCCLTMTASVTPVATFSSRPSDFTAVTNPYHGGPVTSRRGRLTIAELLFIAECLLLRFSWSSAKVWSIRGRLMRLVRLIPLERPAHRAASVLRAPSRT